MALHLLPLSRCCGSDWVFFIVRCVNPLLHFCFQKARFNGLLAASSTLSFCIYKSVLLDYFFNFFDELLASSRPFFSPWKNLTVPCAIADGRWRTVLGYEEFVRCVAVGLGSSGEVWMVDGGSTANCSQLGPLLVGELLLGSSRVGVWCVGSAWWLTDPRFDSLVAEWMPIQRSIRSCCSRFCVRLIIWKRSVAR